MTDTVRRASIQDLDRLVPLLDAYRQFYGQQPDLIIARQFLGDRLTRNESIVLVAENDGGAAVGFVQLYPTFSSILAAPMYVLSDLFVIPEFRRRGGDVVASVSYGNGSCRRSGSFGTDDGDR